MKSYLLLYNEVCGSEEEITEFIDRQTVILNWHIALPSSVFIVSNKSLSALTNIFYKEFEQGTFVIVLINSRQIEGALPFNTWDFITNPKSYEEN